MNEKGSILIIALLVLLMATIISIFMLTASTLETRIAGSDKTYTTFFYGAESGIAPGVKVLLDTINNKSVGDYNGLTWTPDTQPNASTNLLRDEILGFSSSPSGRGFSFQTSGNQTMRTEVRLQRDKPTNLSTGSSAEFGSGYEGAGYGSNAGVHVPYFIRSTATPISSGTSNSSAAVETMYRKVLNARD